MHGHGILYSLKDFHTVFHEHFRDQYPSLLLVQGCCIMLKVSSKLLGNVATGMGMGKPLFETGYLGTSGVLYICVCVCVCVS